MKRSFVVIVAAMLVAALGPMALDTVAGTSSEAAAEAVGPVDDVALAATLKSLTPAVVPTGLLAATVTPQLADGVGLVDTSQGIWHLRTREGDPASFFFGNPGDYPIMGDWNCNGIDTPGLYRRSDGFVYLRNSNTQGPADIRFFFGNPGDFPLAGDFDNDGCDTVSIYRPSEARIYVINELGANEGGLGEADYSYIFGNPGDKPFTGDFNGDGVDTVGLHRESTGFMYFRNTNTQGVAHYEFYFGDPGDRLISGDWLGAGEDFPAVYRPSNRTVYMRYSNTQGNADEFYQWGESAYVPVAGHFGTLHSGVTVNVSNAPDLLRYAIESFYQDQQAAPHIPEGLRSSLLGLYDYPKVKTITGTSTTSTVYGKGVAVVQVGNDTLLAVQTNNYEWRIVGAKPAGLGRPLWYGGLARHVAFIGTDWQFDPGSGNYPSDITRTNADSVHIYATNPYAGSGALVGFPRSTWISSPQGLILMSKTTVLGGPANTVASLKMETGLPIEGYLLISMGTAAVPGESPSGFSDLVDAVGGLPFTVPYNAGPATAGDTSVDGAGAIAFARERMTLPHGGVDRTLAQGLLIKAALAKVKPLGMLQIPNFLSIMDDFVKTNLSIDQLVTLAATIYTLDPGPMPTLTAADLANAGHTAGATINGSHGPYNQNEGSLPNVMIKGCLYTPDQSTFGYQIQPIQYNTFSDLLDGILGGHPWVCDDGS